MNSFVERTCRMSGTDRPSLIPDDLARPLKDFRNEPAYVLLGDPGSGKTTAFRMECKELGVEAVLVSARNFLSLDLDSHPEWRNKILFIDGLDEIRAGSVDARTALDGIRSRLDALGRPHFRISCREADWLGYNDRSNLEFVSPNSQVEVLRLNPLTQADVRSILTAHGGVDDVQHFVENAWHQGVDSLLSNPQTLNMLADVVSANEGWPKSRRETFEMACSQMVREHNEEHIFGRRPSPSDRLLQVAGYMCGTQLIAGRAGYSLLHHEITGDYISLQELDRESPELLRSVLATKLFAAEGASVFVPVHRHISEFLGARYIAKLIEGGLPARRALSLITGEDGVVVSELRGLSAWLAAYHKGVRKQLIETDPIGVGLYGDISDFSLEEKAKLLSTLNVSVASLGSPSPFGPLAVPEMEDTLQAVLNDPSRDDDHQAVTRFVLEVVRQGQPLYSLMPTLERIVHDDTRWPSVTESALTAIIHISFMLDRDTDLLDQLLAEIKELAIPDLNGELLGRLLQNLYPRSIAPSQIWDYLKEGPRPEYVGSHWLFWQYRLLEQSSDDDVGILLDHLYERLPDIRGVFELHRLDSLPMKFLDRALKAGGECQETDRLYKWLSAASFRDWVGLRYTDESIKEVRTWLEQHPNTQKNVFLYGIMSRPEGEEVNISAMKVEQYLCGSAFPSDFGLWCLETAITLADTNPAVSRYLLIRAVDSVEREHHNQGLSREDLIERSRGHDILVEQLEASFDAYERYADGSRQNPIDKNSLRQVQRQREWRQQLRPHVAALFSNEAAPSLLFEIARLYFGDYPSVTRGAIQPAERVKELLGGGDDLAEAALAGLRGTVCREDVPEVDEILRLHSESRMHHLALPFLAGMNELDSISSDQVDILSEAQRCKAIALYLMIPTGSPGVPSWYKRWLDGYPETVALVLIQCARWCIRNGCTYVPGQYEVESADNRAAIARLACLHLLRTFPLRCRSEQLSTLDMMLAAAISYSNEQKLLELVDAKLSRQSMDVAQRMRWVVSGAIVSPSTHLEPMEEYTDVSERRARHLAKFLGTMQSSLLSSGELPVDALRVFVQLLGRYYQPTELRGFTTSEMDASMMVDRLIGILSSLSSKEATTALEQLMQDFRLTSWHERIEFAHDQQRIIRRDAGYQHPSVQQIHGTLDNEGPANTFDLAALVLARLDEIGDGFTTNNTDDWRQYWNEDSYGRPVSPKSESSCRDALLSDLRLRLPSGMDGQREGQYAGGNRADIRVSYQDFSIPIEIKKSNHRDLWSAIRNQLTSKYTTDPATSGFGIYLVFWFGNGFVQVPPVGKLPKTPSDLRAKLQETISEPNSRKISVCVLDVCPPNDKVIT